MEKEAILYKHTHTHTHMHTMEYYSAIKRNTFESVLMKWMNLESITQREISQKEKLVFYTNTYIWNLE